MIRRRPLLRAVAIGAGAYCALAHRRERDRRAATTAAPSSTDPLLVCADLRSPTAKSGSAAHP